MGKHTQTFSKSSRNIRTNHCVFLSAAARLLHIPATYRVCHWYVMVEYVFCWFEGLTLQTFPFNILIAWHSVPDSQRHQVYNCHGCQMSHYPMSTQTRLHIYVSPDMLYGEKCRYKPLFIEGTMTGIVPEDVWKDGGKKITFLCLNNAVLSNIYGTEGKQGQRCTHIDIMTGQGCHRISVWE